MQTKSKLHEIINGKDEGSFNCDRENVILLQVTATPYSLVTMDTRSGQSATFESFKISMSVSRIHEDRVLDMGDRYRESSYYGVNKFVEKTSSHSENQLKSLIPGTYTMDEVGYTGRWTLHGHTMD